MDRFCPTHQLPLERKQGVSKKTNKPYDFWGCTYKPQKGEDFCKYTENSEPPVTNKMIYEEIKDLRKAVNKYLVQNPPTVKPEDTANDEFMMEREMQKARKQVS